MVFDSGVGLSRAPPLIDGSSVPASSFNHDAMWQLNLRSTETMDFVSFPERPGEPDCSYYIRTGLCRFGATCRFNHPPNRTMMVGNARMMGEFPERIGQPECQYYLKTGTCKFGSTCKFHHPRDKAGIAGRVTLNILGYPIRLNENECAYYLRTGECKFGSTCKFHHPQPSNMMVSVSGSPVYPSINSPTNPSPQTYPGDVTNWPISRASLVPSPRWQDASSYAPLMLPHGVVSIPGWNAYGGQMGSISSMEGQHQAVVNNQVYRSHQSEARDPGSEGAYSPYRASAVSTGVYASPGDNMFPERPGQPECQFYMKTGDCKFGAVCRFHHPRERVLPAPDCLLSPLGLPLRQGEPICVFYSRYGICKFGPSCKFDHPMEIFKYNLPTSSSADLPSVSRYLGSSSGSAAISLPSDGATESGSVKPIRLSLSESRPMASGDDNINRDS